MKHLQKIFFLFLLVFLSSCFSDSSTSKIASESEKKDRIILALGDSLTAGNGVEREFNYPAQLEFLLKENGYEYTIVNAGVSGETSLQVLDRAPMYVDLHPEIVLLVVGGNDGLQTLSIEDMKKNILATIDVFPDGKVVLGGIVIPENLGDYAREFQAAYPEIAQERPKVFFQPSFLGEVAGSATLNQHDRVHPTADGYTKIAVSMFDFLKDNDIITK